MAPPPTGTDTARLSARAPHAHRRRVGTRQRPKSTRVKRRGPTRRHVASPLCVFPPQGGGKEGCGEGKGERGRGRNVGKRNTQRSWEPSVWLRGATHQPAAPSSLGMREQGTKGPTGGDRIYVSSERQTQTSSIMEAEALLAALRAHDARGRGGGGGEEAAARRRGGGVEAFHGDGLVLKGKAHPLPGPSAGSWRSRRDASDNTLSELPESIGGMGARVVAVRGNSLSGLPPSVGRLALKVLDGSENRMTELPDAPRALNPRGSWPERIG